MKNKKMILGIAVILVIGLTVIACNKSSSSSSGGGGKSLNSAEELKAYLDSQPANSPDKPIKVSMAINDLMLESVVDVIRSAGKYVSLNITGNALTTIPRRAFLNCKSLVSITIPNSVKSTGEVAFYGCDQLTSVTFQGTIPDNEGEIFGRNDDLIEKYLAGGPGTYTRPNGESRTWTKQ